jgi:hypothetical protein
MTGLVLFLAWSARAGQESSGLAGTEITAAAAVLSVQKDSTRPSPATGTALLDLFIDNLRDMSREGTPDSLDKRLQEMMIAARKAQEAGAIDAVFFLRFKRMLAVTKLVSVPDATGILAPVIEDVLSDFVQDKLGHSGFRDASGKGPKAINYVAQSLAVELINLQIYLDTTQERESLQKKIDERMSRAPGK